MTTEFNPLDYARQLEEAGVPAAQAAIHANALAQVLGDVVFNRDLLEVEHNLRQAIRHAEERLWDGIERLRTELNARIDVLEASLRAEMNGLRAEMTGLRAEMTELRAEMTELRAKVKLLQWMMGTLIAFNAAILVKLLFP